MLHSMDNSYDLISYGESNPKLNMLLLALFWTN